jgi:hypothetical protein
MYAAALKEARGERARQRSQKVGKKKGNKKRDGKRVKKKQSKQAEVAEAGVSAPDGGTKEEEGGDSLEIGGGEAEKEQEEKEQEEEKEELCAICLGPIDDKEEEDPDDVICRVQCTHEFHGGCVGSWTSTCTRKGLSLTCPTCRRPLQFA